MVGTLPVTSLAAGVEMKVVSERLGHSQISVTADLYTHVSRGLGREAADRIAGALRAAGETLPGAFLAQTSKEGSGGDKEEEERARPPPRFRWSGAWIVCLNRARPEGFEPPTF
jgi:hypothetical protein